MHDLTVKELQEQAYAIADQLKTHCIPEGAPVTDISLASAVLTIFDTAEGLGIDMEQALKTELKIRAEKERHR